MRAGGVQPSNLHITCSSFHRVAVWLRPHFVSLDLGEEVSGGKGLALEAPKGFHKQPCECTGEGFVGDVLFVRANQGLYVPGCFEASIRAERMSRVTRKAAIEYHQDVTLRLEMVSVDQLRPVHITT